MCHTCIVTLNSSQKDSFGFTESIPEQKGYAAVFFSLPAGSPQRLEEACLHSHAPGSNLVQYLRTAHQ